MKEKIVIGITGMQGAGKNTALEIVRKLGFPIFIMGDEIRYEAKRRGISPSPENLGKIMLQIRSEKGEGILARRVIMKIKAVRSSVIFVDGIRSLPEVSEFKKAFLNFNIVSIHAPAKTRFARLLKRRRTDDPKNWEAFIVREKRELRVGVNKVMQCADFTILNEGSIMDLRKKFREILDCVLNDEENWRSKSYH